MNLSIKATDPDSVEFTIEATMTLRDWRIIRSAMNTAPGYVSPTSEFSRLIADAILKAESKWNFDDGAA